MLIECRIIIGAVYYKRILLTVGGPNIKDGCYVYTEDLALEVVSAKHQHPVLEYTSPVSGFFQWRRGHYFLINTQTSELQPSFVGD